MNKIENKLVSWVERNVLWLFLSCATVIGMYLRYSWRHFQSLDYEVCLLDWYQQLQDGGGLRALNPAIGNYNLPYQTVLALFTYIPINPLYLIKGFSIVFDFLLAAGAGMLTYELTGKNKWKGGLAYVGVFFLPTVWLNSSCWAQCDSVYTAFLIWSLWALIDGGKKNLAILLLGVSFAFKLQAVFLLPVFIYCYFSKREFSLLRLIVLGLLPNFILCIPGYLVGCSPFATFEVYGGQTGGYEQLTLNMPNIYHLLPADVAQAGTSFLCVCVLGLGAVLLLIIIKKVSVTPKLMLSLALWTVLWVVFLMPHMHERYLIFGDILSVLWVIVYKKKPYLPVCVSLISLSGYLLFLFNVFGPDWMLVSIAYLAVLIDFSWELVRELCDGSQKSAGMT